MNRVLAILCITFIARPATGRESYFAPGVIDRKPKASEKTLGNQIRSKQECSKRNGQWSEGNGYATCVLPYADAGKPCRNSKDCIGHCIMPLNKLTLDGKPLAEGYGICQLN